MGTHMYGYNACHNGDLIQAGTCKQAHVHVCMLSRNTKKNPQTNQLKEKLFEDKEKAGPWLFTSAFFLSISPLVLFWHSHFLSLNLSQMARAISLKQKPVSVWWCSLKEKVNCEESLPELCVPASSKQALECLGVLLRGCSMLQLELLMPTLISLFAHSYMSWRQSSVETQVLQAALQDVPTGNVKPVYQLYKSKPEAHIQPSHEEPVPQGTGSRKWFSVYPWPFSDLVAGNVNKNLKKTKSMGLCQWKSVSLRCRGKMLPFSFWCNQSLYVMWTLVGNSLPESCLLVGVSEAMRGWELTITPPHISLLHCMDETRLVAIVIHVTLICLVFHRGR